MYGMYYGTLFVLIIWLINLKLNIISLPDYQVKGLGA